MTSRVALTDAELTVTAIALRDYLMESERYLRGVRPTDHHDPCCASDRGHRERLAEQERDLTVRVDTTRSALVAVRKTLAGLATGHVPCAAHGCAPLTCDTACADTGGFAVCHPAGQDMGG